MERCVYKYVHNFLLLNNIITSNQYGFTFGPNIEPWGTPAFIVFHSEFDLFKTTRWDRPERYLSNHTKRLPDSQYRFSLNNNP
jgi:hypothetical protein